MTDRHHHHHHHQHQQQQDQDFSVVNTNQTSEQDMTVDVVHQQATEASSSSAPRATAIKSVQLRPMDQGDSHRFSIIVIDKECHMGRKKTLAPECRFSDARISSTHCHIAITGDDRQNVVLTDHSSNGTFVNDTRVGKGNSVLLKSGDRISLVAVSGVGQDAANKLPCFVVKLIMNDEECQENESGATVDLEDSTLPVDNSIDFDQLEALATDADIQTVRNTKKRSREEYSDASVLHDHDSSPLYDGNDVQAPPVKRSRYKAPDSDDDGDSSGSKGSGRAMSSEASSNSTGGEHVDHMLEQLTCGICADLFYRPVSVIPCLHNFCAHCLTGWCFGAGRDTCPQCRGKMEGVNRNHGIANLVEAYIKSNPASDRRTEEEKKDHDENNRFTDELIRKGPRAIVRELRNFSDGFDDEDEDESNSDDDESDDGSPTHRYYAPFDNRCIECDNPSPIDGHQCSPGQSHVVCSACRRLIPQRQDVTDPQRTHQCGICAMYFCNRYFNGGCLSGVDLSPLNSFSMYRIPLSSFSGNATERNILEDYMRSKQLSPQAVFDTICRKIDTGEYRISGERGDTDASIQGGSSSNSNADSDNEADSSQVNTNSTRASGQLYCCSNCAHSVFSRLVYLYRSDIPNEELPASVTSRPDCWYGRECRTQRHNQRHALRLNHICENTRRQ